MSDRGEDRAGTAGVEAVCSSAVWRLREAGVAPEALAELVPAGRRMLVLPRAATMRPLGEAWRLGALLLGASEQLEGRLYAAGRATRAAERGRSGYQSLSREERRDLAAAALHGGYPAGTSVNFDAAPLPFDEAAVTVLGPDSPIGLVDGELRVRWRAGAPLDGAPTLQRYLDERIDLLIDPPLGST